MGVTGVSEEQALSQAQLGLGLLSGGSRSRGEQEQDRVRPGPRGAEEAAMLGALCRNQVPSQDGGQHAELARATAHSLLSRRDPWGELEINSTNKYPSRSRRAQGRAGHSLRHRAFLAGWAVDCPRCQGSQV